MNLAGTQGDLAPADAAAGTHETGTPPCPLWERAAAVVIVAMLATAFFGTFALAHASRPQMAQGVATATTDAAEGDAGADFSPEILTPTVGAFYLHAAEHPDVYQQVPCYCGCASFADHANLSDCFVRPDTGAWDPHAAGCGICQEEAAVVRQLLDDGRSAAEVRAAIIKRFGPSTGPGTA